MKLQIMSDLHLEMHADRGRELIRGLDPTGVDVLVLAGDITTARYYEDLESIFKALVTKYRHILYIPGNHEYYKSSPTQVTRNLVKLTKALPEVVIPQNTTGRPSARPLTSSATGIRPRRPSRVAPPSRRAPRGRLRVPEELSIPDPAGAPFAADLIGVYDPA